MSRTCERRFGHTLYLLTCELESGHKGQHKDGEYGWAADDGFDYVYEDGMVVGTVPEQVEPEIQTFEEAAASAPKFYDGAVKVTANKDGVFPAGSLKKLSIAERLAERKALNASLTKPKP